MFICVCVYIYIYICTHMYNPYAMYATCCVVPSSKRRETDLEGGQGLDVEDVYYMYIYTHICTHIHICV